MFSHAILYNWKDSILYYTKYVIEQKCYLTLFYFLFCEFEARAVCGVVTMFCFMLQRLSLWDAEEWSVLTPISLYPLVRVSTIAACSMPGSDTNTSGGATTSASDTSSATLSLGFDIAGDGERKNLFRESTYHYEEIAQIGNGKFTCERIDFKCLLFFQSFCTWVVINICCRVFALGKIVWLLSLLWTFHLLYCCFFYTSWVFKDLNIFLSGSRIFFFSPSFS